MSTILAGTLLLTATGLFSQVVGFLYRMALSRLIGAETMGLYQLVMPVYSMLMSVTAVGLTVAVSTLSARYHALGDSGTVKLVLRRALRNFFLLAVPLGLAVAVLSDPISVYLLGDARTRLGVVVMVPCMLLTGVENLHKHCFYGIGRVRPPAAVETAEQLIRAGAVLLLLAALLPRSAEETVGIIALGMVLCEVFSACALTLLFKRHWRRFPPGPAGADISGKRLMSIALPVGATSLLGTLLGSANSVLIPAKLVEGGMTLSEAMSEFGVLCGMTLPMLGLPTGFIGALCLVMVPDLSRLVEGGMTLSEAMSEFGVLNGLGLQGKAARNAILSDVVQLAFTFFAVSRFGLAGFAAGYAASGLAGAGLNLASVLRAAELRVKVFEWFARPLLASVLMGLWCNLLFRVMLDAGCGHGWASLACTVLGLVVYAAALLAQGLSVTDLFARTGRYLNGKRSAI